MALAALVNGQRGRKSSPGGMSLYNPGFAYPTSEGTTSRSFAVQNDVRRRNPSVNEPRDSVGVIVRPMRRGHTRDREQILERERTEDKELRRPIWSSKPTEIHERSSQLP